MEGMRSFAVPVGAFGGGGGEWVREGQPLGIPPFRNVDVIRGQPVG